MTNNNFPQKNTQKKSQGQLIRPRLVVYRSNKYISAQLVDDTRGHTLACVNNASDPVVAGKEIAVKARSAKIEFVTFDRAGYKYHGQVKKLAEAARDAGLKF